MINFVLSVAKMFFPGGILSKPHPWLATLRIDPNPGVPLESTTEITLHRRKSLTLVGVVLDLPGSKTAKNGDYKSRGRGNRSIGKSPSQFYLTKTERRNESSIFRFINNQGDFAIN